MADDLFAPPTKDELAGTAIFAPPTKEEIAASSPAPMTSDQTAEAAYKSMDDSGQASNDALFNVLTAGHLPQIKAKMKQIWNGEGVANDQNYVQRRDAELADIADKAQKYPGASLEGKIAGFIAPMLLTGGGSAAAEGAASAAPAVMGEAAEAAAPANKLLTAAKFAGKNAAIGGAMGFAQNPGDAPGVVDLLQLDARKTNGEIGAALGGTISAAASKIPDAAEAIDQYANSKFVKAAGATKADFGRLFKKDSPESLGTSVQDLGKFISDNKLATAGDTFQSVAQKASSLKTQTGQQLGDGYEAATKILSKLGPDAQAKVDAAGFNPVRDKDAILAQVKTDLGYAYGRKPALKAVSDYLDDLGEEHGDQVLNPATTNEIKTGLDQSAINYKRNPQTGQPDSEAALASLRKILNGKVKGQIQSIGEAIGDPDAAARLTALNAKYGQAANVSNIATDRTAREMANRSFGLTDTISGGVGADIGSRIGQEVAGTPGAIGGAIIGGAAGAVSNKASRTFGPAIVATAAKNVSQKLAGLPEASAAKLASPAVYNELSGGAIPLKGEAKWANDGFQNLIDHASDKDTKDSLQKQKGAMLADPKIKSLLVQASSARPGSKAMQNLMDQVKAKIAGNSEGEE